MNVSGIKEFRDGLTEKVLCDKYPWVHECRVAGLILGIRDGELVWYDRRGITHIFERSDSRA